MGLNRVQDDKGWAIIISRMNKRHLHHIWTRFRVINPWVFVTLAVLSLIVSAFAMRSNYQHMAKLRQAVFTADEQNGDVQKALNELRNYVYAHMNTSLSKGNSGVYPPIQLKYTYDRLVQAASGNTAEANSKVYTEAQAYCEQQNSSDFSGRNRVPCIEQYVSTHGPSTTHIPDALYKFDFASPRWSPDLAGWSLLLTIVSAFAAAILFGLRFWFKHELK